MTCPTRRGTVGSGEEAGPLGRQGSSSVAWESMGMAQMTCPGQGREWGGGWLAGKAGLQRGGTGRRGVARLTCLRRSGWTQWGLKQRSQTSWWTVKVNRGRCVAKVESRRVGRERGRGGAAGRAGLQCSGTGRRRRGIDDVSEARQGAGEGDWSAGRAGLKRGGTRRV
jgi:hypothetical protein